MTEKDIAKIRKFSRFTFPFDFPRKDDEIDTTEKQLQIIINILKRGGENLRKLIISSLYALDIISFFSEGGDFLSLDETRTKRLLIKLTTSSSKTPQNIFRIMRFISTISFWDSFGNEKIGFKIPQRKNDIPKISWEIPEEETKLKIEGYKGVKWDIERIKFGKFVRRDIRIVSDVIVVGSGISAGIISERLTREDISVSILEKGYFIDAETPSVFLSQSSELLGMFPVSSIANINAFFGKGIGGLGNLSFSVFEKMPDDAKDIWRKFHGVSTKEILLDFATKEAEEVINSKGNGNANSKSETIEKLSEFFGAQSKNFNKIKGEKVNLLTGEEVFSPEKLIKYAVHFGANLYLGFEVEKISRGKKWFVEGKIKDEFGNTKANFIAESKAVFLCGGPYGNTKILWNSGFKEKALGRKVKIHPAGLITAIFKSPQEQKDSSNYIELSKEGMFIKEIKLAPGVWSSIFPGMFGPDLVKTAKKYPFSRTFIFWFREVGESYFVKTPFGIMLRTNLKGEDIAKFLFAIREISLALLSCGAREVYHPIRSVPPFTSPDDINNSNIEKVKPNQLEILSIFQTGGCPIGFSSDTGLCDSTGRVFGEKSLFISDSSSLPDSVLVPPMLTSASVGMLSANSFIERKIFILK
jgi:hypothetical protein